MLSTRLFCALIASISLFFTGSAASCTGINAIRPGCDTSESAYHRDIFYIGGHYEVYNITEGTSMYSDQVYVEKLTSVHGLKKATPIVFLSAGIPSGSLWLNTPDNRKGWVSYFIDQGYQIYILDITANGRSGQNGLDKYPLRIGTTDSNMQAGFTAPELYGAYPQAINHTQWPGNGTRGDPIFDAFMAAVVPLTSNSTSQELSMRAAGCRLLSLIGKSFLISHSAGGTYTALMSDECPDLIQANINLEPGNIPFQWWSGNSSAGGDRIDTREYGLTRTPITYNPPINSSSDLNKILTGDDSPAKRSCYIQNPNGTIHTLPNIAKVPYVFLTGDASPHVTYDHCFPLFLDQAGVKDVTWIKLWEKGIFGNAHFFMIEKNNLEIAAVVGEWIEDFERRMTMKH
ncbi:hypothetical protein AC579_7479 [Pseudocercospora musae]|uniref:AB hydrolase-1 domain-containing protein n=1 Tax=Pseudocercospora musae TaxID=113226 RepID=A0A139ICX1_9PEZI|nr:hypothetical protein AC579_7479 [Pseudocercospora musae]